jgi:hypothetical protein
MIKNSVRLHSYCASQCGFIVVHCIVGTQSFVQCKNSFRIFIFKFKREFQVSLFKVNITTQKYDFFKPVN